MIPFAFVALLQMHDYYFGVASRGLIGWIIIGLLAGWIAGHLTRGRGFGCVVDVILGLIGAVVGGWIFTKLGIVALGILGKPRGRDRRRRGPRGHRAIVRRRQIRLNSTASR